MNSKSLQENYQKRVNNLRNELSRLGKDAEAIKLKVDKAREAQQTIVTKQRELSYIAGEKDGLKEEWSNAHFENDTQAIEEVESKKAELDNRAKELDGEIAELRQTIKASSVDIQTSTELAVALDMLRIPHVWTYTNELQKLLRAEANELEEAKKKSRGVLPTDVDLYDDERSAVDANWKSSARRQKEIQDREQREYELWNSATKGGSVTL